LVDVVEEWAVALGRLVVKEYVVQSVYEIGKK
jgi:hypothetical protein